MTASSEPLRDEPAILGDALPATRVRFGVLGFLGSMTFVLYLDRICLGTAAVSISSDLNLSPTEMGWVHGAFTISYGLFEVPTGHLGDRYGSRGVLTRIVLWWSAFTALTGQAIGLWSIVICRFLFGAGEAGALPNAARVLERWFPEHSRGRAQGFVTTCMLVGGTAAPVTIAWLLQHMSWRSVFLLLGAIGSVWAVAFYLWFRDDPEQHSQTNEAERRLIAAGRVERSSEHPPVPWGIVLTSPNVWLIGALMSCISSVFYMLFSWYPTYLIQVRGVDKLLSGTMTSVVLSGGAVGGVVGGILTDWLVRRSGSRRWSRCGLGCISLTSGALLILAAMQCESAWQTSLCLCGTLFCIQLQIPSWWATVTQISGRHLGALFGLMNSMGIPGAVSAQMLMGPFVEWMASRGYEGRAQWDPGFLIFAGVLALGIVMWLLINPEKSVVERHGEVGVA